MSTKKGKSSFLSLPPTILSQRYLSLVELFSRILNHLVCNIENKSTNYLVRSILVGEKTLQVTIHNASLKDLETLYEIEKECFTHEAFSKKQIAYFLKAPEAVSLVAYVNGETAGFILGLTEQHEKSWVGHICTVDVASRYRKLGVARRLLDEIEMAFIRKGAENCLLEVRVDNVAARKLYQKLGYIEVGKLKDYYAKGIHGVRLKKRIKDP